MGIILARNLNQLNKKLNLMRYLLLLSILFLGFQSFAQPGEAEIEIKDGKKYYVHFVQAGNTLYGIHRLYEVPVEEIILANPGVEDGLATGQKILVPIQGREGLEKNLIIHIVQEKETVYGISKKYEVTEAEINELNPEIKEGLKIGQEIKIPVKNGLKEPKPANPFETNVQTNEKFDSKFKVSFKDTVILHQVQKGETLYSISKRYMVTERELKELNNMRSSRIRPGDEILIPIMKERIEPVGVREIERSRFIRPLDSLFLFRRKEKYKVALFMPLYYDDESKEVVSDLATAYYMGAKLALDSLANLGFEAEVQIIDTKNDTNAIKKTLESPRMLDMDLIFGPFFGKNAGVLSRWAANNRCRMVCPFATNYEVLKNNPLVYQSG